MKGQTYGAKSSIAQASKNQSSRDKMSSQSSTDNKSPASMPVAAKTNPMGAKSSRKGLFSTQKGTYVRQKSVLEQHIEQNDDSNELNTDLPAAATLKVGPIVFDAQESLSANDPANLASQYKETSYQNASTMPLQTEIIEIDDLLVEQKNNEDYRTQTKIGRLVYSGEFNLASQQSARNVNSRHMPSKTYKSSEKEVAITFNTIDRLNESSHEYLSSPDPIALKTKDEKIQDCDVLIKPPIITTMRDPQSRLTELASVGSGCEDVFQVQVLKEPKNNASNDSFCQYSGSDEILKTDHDHDHVVNMRSQETEISPVKGSRFKNKTNQGPNAEIVLKMDIGNQAHGKGLISVTLNNHMVRQTAKTRPLSNTSFITGHQRVSTCMLPSKIEKHSSYRRIETLQKNQKKKNYETEHNTNFDSEKGHSVNNQDVDRVEKIKCNLKLLNEIMAIDTRPIGFSNYGYKKNDVYLPLPNHNQAHSGKVTAAPAKAQFYQIKQYSKNNVQKRSRGKVSLYGDAIQTQSQEELVRKISINTCTIGQMMRSDFFKMARAQDSLMKSGSQEIVSPKGRNGVKTSEDFYPTKMANFGTKDIEIKNLDFGSQEYFQRSEIAHTLVRQSKNDKSPNTVIGTVDLTGRKSNDYQDDRANLNAIRVIKSEVETEKNKLNYVKPPPMLLVVSPRLRNIEIHQIGTLLQSHNSVDKEFFELVNSNSNFAKVQKKQALTDQDQSTPDRKAKYLGNPVQLNELAEVESGQELTAVEVFEAKEKAIGIEQHGFSFRADSLLQKQLEEGKFMGINDFPGRLMTQDALVAEQKMINDETKVFKLAEDYDILTPEKEAATSNEIIRRAPESPLTAKHQRQTSSQVESAPNQYNNLTKFKLGVYNNHSPLLKGRENPPVYLTADKVSTENIGQESSAIRTGAMSVVGSFEGRKSRKSTLKLDDSPSPIKIISEQQKAGLKQKNQMNSQTQIALEKLGLSEKPSVETFSDKAPIADFKLTKTAFSRNNLVSTSKDLLSSKQQNVLENLDDKLNKVGMVIDVRVSRERLESQRQSTEKRKLIEINKKNQKLLSDIINLDKGNERNLLTDDTMAKDGSQSVFYSTNQEAVKYFQQRLVGTLPMSAQTQQSRKIQKRKSSQTYTKKQVKKTAELFELVGNCMEAKSQFKSPHHSKLFTNSKIPINMKFDQQTKEAGTAPMVSKLKKPSNQFVLQFNDFTTQQRTLGHGMQIIGSNYHHSSVPAKVRTEQMILRRKKSRTADHALRVENPRTSQSREVKQVIDYSYINNSDQIKLVPQKDQDHTQSAKLSTIPNGQEKKRHQTMNSFLNRPIEFISSKPIPKMMTSHTQAQSLGQTLPGSRVATAPIMKQSQRSVHLKSNFDSLQEALNNKMLQGANSQMGEKNVMLHRKNMLQRQKIAHGKTKLGSMHQQRFSLGQNFVLSSQEIDKKGTPENGSSTLNQNMFMSTGSIIKGQIRTPGPFQMSQTNFRSAQGASQLFSSETFYGGSITAGETPQLPLTSQIKHIKKNELITQTMKSSLVQPFEHTSSNFYMLYSQPFDQSQQTLKNRGILSNTLNQFTSVLGTNTVQSATNTMKSVADVLLRNAPAKNKIDEAIVYVGQDEPSSMMRNNYNQESDVF